VSGAAAIPFAHGQNPFVRDDDKLVFEAHLKMGNIDKAITESPLKMVVNLPLGTLGPSLNYHSLKMVCKLHRIDCSGRSSGAWLLHEFVNHACDGTMCGDFVTVFIIDRKEPVGVLKRNRECKVILREDKRRKKLESAKRSKLSDALVEKKRCLREKKKKVEYNEGRDRPRFPAFASTKKTLI